MNKKAFVLMETIVVIVVISVALLTIFASYNKILSKVKTENKYDTSEYIYMTNYVKNYLENLTGTQIIEEGDAFAMDSTSGEPNNYCETGHIDCENNVFKIESIFLLKNLNKTINENLAKFDAYIIDYIRKLDVGDNDTILVVEYKRPAIKIDGSELKDYVGGIETNQLYETYIASLEW